MHLSIGDLGRRLTRREVQDLLGISEDILLSDPLRFGGVWFGPRKLVFFEKFISGAFTQAWCSVTEDGTSAPRISGRPRRSPLRTKFAWR